MTKLSGIHETIHLVAKEGLRHKWSLVLVFSVLCSVGVGLGMVWPKNYTSSVTIYIEQQNIIDPLMEGRAVRAEVSGVASNAREIVYTRSLLLRALKDGGIINDDTSPEAREQALQSIRARTVVTGPGDNLIRISYRGGDAQSVYAMTKRLGELFVDEMLHSKERESQAAFNFIDMQVRKYETELHHAQDQLNELRERHPNAQPGALDELTRRQVTLRGQIDDLEQKLREDQIRQSSLQEQLSGEAEVSTIMTRAQQYRAQIAELRGQLETLRLSYKESYPDIMQLKQQIADLETGLQKEEARRRDLKSKGASGMQVDETVRSNPVYQQLQRDLYNVRTDIRTLAARLEDTKSKLVQAREQGTQVQDVQGEIEKLRRDYQVNEDIYEDLLRRRENARVSLNLDTEQQGLTLRIREPAYLPASPDGPRMLHFALAGGVLGLGVPIGALFLLLTVDPRVRHESQMPPAARELLLATIPRAYGRRARRRARFSVVVAALVSVAVVALLTALMFMRNQGML